MNNLFETSSVHLDLIGEGWVGDDTESQPAVLADRVADECLRNLPGKRPNNQFDTVSVCVPLSLSSCVDHIARIVLHIWGRKHSHKKWVLWVF